MGALPSPRSPSPPPSLPSLPSLLHAHAAAKLGEGGGGPEGAAEPAAEAPAAAAPSPPKPQPMHVAPTPPRTVGPPADAGAPPALPPKRSSFGAGAGGASPSAGPALSKRESQSSLDSAASVEVWGWDWCARGG